MPYGWDLGCLGVKIKLCPLGYLLNHLMKSNQIWFVSYSHEWGVQYHIFCPVLYAPGAGFKGQISLNFQLHKIISIFIPNKLCVCVLTNI